MARPISLSAFPDRIPRTPLGRANGTRRRCPTGPTRFSASPPTPPTGSAPPAQASPSRWRTDRPGRIAAVDGEPGCSAVQSSRSHKAATSTPAWVAIHLSGLPGERPLSETGRAARLPRLALLRVGFTEPAGSPPSLVRSYRTLSPLPVRTRRPAIGGFLSVALSCGSPRLAVSQHPALRSPDLPRHDPACGPCRGHPADSPSPPVCHRPAQPSTPLFAGARRPAIGRMPPQPPPKYRPCGS